MSELVSVVIPAHNRAFIIRDALNSILKQTYQNWEVLVVDDSSTDETNRVVKKYAREDSRIRLIQHARQKGAQAARNTGICAARGKWIAFLDSDDKWLPYSLEARLKLAVKKSDVVHSDCYVLNSLGESEMKRFGVPPMEGLTFKELLQRPGPMFQALLVSKEALARIAFLDESIVSYQEWDTAIRLARCCSFHFVKDPTFIYDCRHGNTISKDLLRGAIGYEQVITKHRWSILRYLGPQTLASHYRQAAGFYLDAQAEYEADRCLLRAKTWWPFGHPTFRTTARSVAKIGLKLIHHARRHSC